MVPDVDNVHLISLILHLDGLQEKEEGLDSESKRVEGDLDWS